MTKEINRFVLQAITATMIAASLNASRQLFNTTICQLAQGRNIGNSRILKMENALNKTWYYQNWLDIVNK